MDREAWCPWVHKKSDMTEWLNWTESLKNSSPLSLGSCWLMLMSERHMYSLLAAAAAAKLLQSCLTLCYTIDGSPPDSSVPGILQARKLEWVAISFSNAWEWKVKVKSLSCVQLLATPWPIAYRAPLSMGFSRQEYWNGLPFPSPLLAESCSNVIKYV